jgi:hypothetical protein
MWLGKYEGGQAGVQMDAGLFHIVPSCNDSLQSPRKNSSAQPLVDNPKGRV